MKSAALRTGTLLVLAAILLSPAFSQQPLFFVQLTDPQFGMYSGNMGFEQESANLTFAVATVNRLKPSFVVITGDLVNAGGNAAQIDEYLRLCGQIDSSIPVYHVPGNHDVGNVPTPESLEGYRKRFGRDYYSFRAGPLYGIVLNSAVIHSPANVPGELAAQEDWLLKELENAKGSGARHIVLFQHHPYFIKDPIEPDKYENIPLERRRKYLDLLERYGVRYVFSGHYHQNAAGRDGELDMIVSGPLGMPLGGARSGIRVGAVTERGLVHKFYELGDLPHRLSDLFK